MRSCQKTKRKTWNDTCVQNDLYNRSMKYLVISQRMTESLYVAQNKEGLVVFGFHSKLMQTILGWQYLQL